MGSRLRLLLPAFLAAIAALGLPALAAHHTFHITNNASQRITSLTMIYHLPGGSTVQQSYNISIPLRVIKDISIPHSVATSSGSVDTSDACAIDLAIVYSSGTAVWLKGEDLCAKPNIEARDSYASDFYNAAYATPIPDLTPAPTAAPATPQPKATPRSPAAEALFRGEQFFDKGNFTAAMPYFNRALKLNPRDTLAYAYRGRTYFLMNKLQPSLNDLDAALRIDSQEALLHWIRGNTEWASGLTDSALEDYSVTGQEVPDIQGYMTVLSALAAQDNGDPQKAKSLLAGCVAPCGTDKWVQRDLQYLQGKITGRDLINAAGTTFQRGDAHAIVGFALLARGKPAEAKVHFTWVMQHADPIDNWRPIIRTRLARMK